MLFLVVVFILLTLGYRFATEGVISGQLISPRIDRFLWSGFMLFVGYLRLERASKSTSNFDKFSHYIQAVIGLGIGLYLLITAFGYV